MMSISNRLNEAMEGGDGRPKVSQSELSRRCGVPQPTIARILKGGGKRGPETATLIALAGALGVEFMWLQQGSGPKHASGMPERRKIEPVAPREKIFNRHWLDEDEAEHLAEYRSLTEQNRKRLRSVVKGMKRDPVVLDAVDNT